MTQDNTDWYALLKDSYMALKINSGDHALWYRHGVILQAIGDKPQAVKAFKAVLRIAPNVESAWEQILSLSEETRASEDALELAISGYKSALNAFLTNKTEVAAVFVESQRAKCGGAAFTLKLCSDGTYQMIWGNPIGSNLDAPGILLTLPTCQSDVARFIQLIHTNFIEIIGQIYSSFGEQIVFT